MMTLLEQQACCCDDDRMMAGEESVFISMMATNLVGMYELVFLSLLNVQYHIVAIWNSGSS